MSDVAAVRAAWAAIAQLDLAPVVGAAGDRTLDGGETAELARRLAVRGLQRTVIPAELGGEGLPLAVLGARLEAIAPVLGFTAFHVVPRFLAGSGNQHAIATLLPGLLSGEVLGCAAISEPAIGSDAGNIACRAEKRGDRYVLSGHKTWVLGGSGARWASAMVVTDPAAGSRGISRMLVDLHQPGVLVEDVPMRGATALPMSTIVFDGAETPLELLMGEEGRGFAMTLRGLEASRAAVASHAVGIAQAALDAAIAYAGERQQFGRSIAGFQLIQSIIARAYADVSAARLMAEQAWTAIDAAAGTQSRASTVAASAAKFFCVDVAVRVTQQCMEVFGAAGLRDDLPVKRLHGYATGLAAPDGTLQINQLILARELLGTGAFV